MKCPHCKTETVSHGDEGIKAGYHHCNGCGCCLSEDGFLRPNSSGCPKAESRPPIFDAPAETGEPAERDGVTSIPLSVTKGNRQAPEGAEIAPEDSPNPERITRKKAV